VLLYHGTCERIARLALTEGLLCREDSGVKSIWEHTVESNPELVYLTIAYAPYFAYHAVPDEDDPGEQFGHRWGIVEIDTDLLDENMMLPDEDFLEQISRGQDLSEMSEDFPEGNYMTERTQWFRDHLGAFAHLWQKSLAGLGNCAHSGSILPEAVTRVVLYDPGPNSLITMASLDPMISTMNYRFCGPKYEGIIKWMFGETMDAGLFSHGGLDAFANIDLTEVAEEHHAALREQQKWAREHQRALTAALADHSTIELLTKE